LWQPISPGTHESFGSPERSLTFVHTVQTPANTIDLEVLQIQE